MKPFLVDTHCHINFAAYKNDIDEVIKRTLAENIWLNAVGSQIDTSRRAVALAEKYDGVFAIVGLHPTHLFAHEVDEEEVHFQSRQEDFSYKTYKELASHPKVVGIGECGLDYYHLPPELDLAEVKKKQAEVFLAQAELALELNKVLMVHCRDAHTDIQKIITPLLKRGLKAVIHCFTGTKEEAELYLQLGCYISFTGIITFPPKKNAKDARPDVAEVIKAVPLDRLLVETDAPYLSPVPYRGKRNEPAYVRFVAEKIAEVKGLTVQEVAEQTVKNTGVVFGFC